MSIFDLLSSQLGGEATRQLSQRLGADEGSTGKAISAALPMLMGALARNSSSSRGAEALAGALARDHDGSILDDVGGFLGGATPDAGAGILKHVLGGRQPMAEGALAQASGLDGAQVGQLLAMLAPVVLGALGKAQRQKDLDAGSLAGMLGGEMRQVERRAPQADLGLLSILDADGDGSVADDLAEKGIGLLGRMLSGRRRR